MEQYYFAGIDSPLIGKIWRANSEISSIGDEISIWVNPDNPTDFTSTSPQVEVNNNTRSLIISQVLAIIFLIALTITIIVILIKIFVIFKEWHEKQLPKETYSAEFLEAQKLEEDKIISDVANVSRAGSVLLLTGIIKVATFLKNLILSTAKDSQDHTLENIIDNVKEGIHELFDGDDENNEESIEETLEEEPVMEQEIESDEDTNLEENTVLLNDYFEASQRVHQKFMEHLQAHRNNVVFERIPDPNNPDKTQCVECLKRLKINKIIDHNWEVYQHLSRTTKAPESDLDDEKIICPVCEAKLEDFMSRFCDECGENVLLQ